MKLGVKNQLKSQDINVYMIYVGKEVWKMTTTTAKIHYTPEIGALKNCH